MMTEEQRKALIEVPIQYIQEPKEGLSENDSILEGVAVLQEGKEVPVKFDDGEAVLLPADRAMKAIQERRAKLYSYDEQMKDRDEQLYGDRPLAAGALGVARTLSFGASDVAASMLGAGETVRGIEEANPAATIAGEIGGAFVPGLGQLGASRLAAKGALKSAQLLGEAASIAEKPFQALSKIGRGAETAIAKVLGEGTAKTIAAQAIGGATEGSIAGALMGLTQASIKGAEDLPEYLSAGIEGAMGGAVFGGVVGGTIGGIAERQAIKESSKNFVKKQFDKVKAIKDEVLTKEKEVNNYLKKDSTATRAVDILDSEFPVFGEQPKVMGGEGGLVSAKKVYEAADEFGVDVYASQIDASKNIANKEQEILRSNTETGEKLREKLYRDSEKVASEISKEVTSPAGDLAIYSDDELAQLAQGTIVKTIQEKLKPFQEPYKAIEERGKKLNIDATDFVKLFRRAAANKSNVEKYGGNVSRNSKVNKLALDIAEQKTITGIWNVQKKIRAELRDAAKGGDDFMALQFMDDYITEHWDNFSRPWRVADKKTHDLALQELKSIRKDLNEINAAYSVYKQEVEQIKDIVKLPDYALKSPQALYDYFQKPGTITPEGFMKKLQSGDATAIRALKYFPNLDKFAKVAQVDKLISKSKRNAANVGRTFSDGSEYFDIRNFSKNWSEMSKEQKNFLYTPEQQKKIQLGVDYLMQFEYAGHKATPYRYLNQSLGQMIEKSSMAEAAGDAAGIATAAIGGMNPASLAMAVATRYAGRKIAQMGQNYLEARALAKIKGLTDLGAEKYSKLSGVVGAARKQESRITKKIKESVDAVFDSFEENRAKIIQGTKPTPDLKEDQTKKDLLEEYSAVTKELEKIRGNEEGYLEMAMEELKDISDVAPDVAGEVASKQLQIAQYLLSKIPPNPFGDSGSPYAKMWRPSDVQIRQFIIAKNAATAPVSVIEDIKKGVVSPTAIDALVNLYPAIYGKIVSQIKEKAHKTEKPLSEDQKALFSVVLQGPFDETFSPQFISSVKAANQNLKTMDLTGPSTQGGPIRQAAADKSKFAQRSATGTEKLMTRT